MLRSLYAGVSGLRNHQMKMDVLGNNIANINTVGFKGGRINFAEAVSQMIDVSSRNAAGISMNPMQVGLGMKANSIDTLFNQGALENTGNVTDMAIEGDGFFVLRAGEKNVYTRNGTFYFDSKGVLVNQQGLPVQGWMMNADGTSNNMIVSNVGNITFDSDFVSEAIATKNVWLNGNLNAGLTPETEVWTSGGIFTTKAVLTGSVPGFPLTVAAGTNDQLTIEFQPGSGTLISEELTLTAGTYADENALATELNAQIAANANLTGKIEAVAYGGGIKFRSIDGNTDTTITLKDGTNTVLADIGFTDGASATAGSQATAGTEINDLLQVSTALATNDTINIAGTDSDETAVNTDFTYGVDGTTLGELVNAINVAYSGVSAALQDGRIVMTDDVPGDSSTTISLTGGTGNTGAINLPSFFNTTPGFTGKVSTSVVVYDSLGGSHNLVVEFTKTQNTGEWTWQVITSEEEKVISGGTGKAQFDSSGKLTSFTYDNGVSTLTLSPGNGAEMLSIDIHAESTDEFSGLSQFDSVTTLSTRLQDGRPTGNLVGISIDHQGVILGTFSNGDDRSLAKIALAQFANNDGLISVGEGLLHSSLASGEAKIFGLNEDLPASIISGALEMSNVDLAKEFTEMITAQRGFQANAKIITTTDQMIDELIRIKR